MGRTYVLIDSIDELYKRRHWRYWRVDELVAKRGPEKNDFLFIKLIMARPDLTEKNTITYYFDQCIDFEPIKVSNFSGIHLMIEHKRSDFREEVRFRVYDEEHKAFDFLCGQFVVEIDE
ncbi:hypothetical protein DTW90_07690 [Neorhizobium sp. P12A]|nr:hypothetical protein DTW90_07690 [Neorhizobium sp. P12A]